MWHAWKKEEIHTKFRSENLKGRDHFGDLDVDGKVTSKFIAYMGPK